MILVKVDWNLFQVKYMRNNEVFVVEDDFYFTFWTVKDFMCVVSEYEKGTAEQNIMFIERYISHNPLVAKAQSIHLPEGMSYKTIEEQEDETDERMAEAAEEQGAGEEEEIRQDELSQEDKELVEQRIREIDSGKTMITEELRESIDRREVEEDSENEREK